VLDTETDLLDQHICALGGMKIPARKPTPRP
jgi:hypothetical protein